jgi:tetratricopeptide (TPR) repeat protein
MGIKVGDFMDVADEYFAAGEFADAADTYYLLYQTYPVDPAAEDAVYRAGFVFAEKLSNNQKALEALEDALLAFPSSQHVEKALYEVGRIREEEELPEQAEIALLRLVSEFPLSRFANEAHYILGKVYLQMRHNKDAIQEFARVIDKSTDTRLSARADRMLDQCRWFVYNSSDGLPSDDISALAPDSKYIWIGTSAGITRFDLEANKPTREELLKGTDILALAVDDLHLWIGTRDGGLKRYNRLENIWASYPENERLSSVTVPSISIDSDSVWVGTAYNGIYRYDRIYGVWTNYTMSDGLPSNQIASIASTLNGIWCGTWKNGGCFFNSLIDRWQAVAEISTEATEVTVTSIAAGANYVWFAWYGESSNGASKYDVSTQAWELHPLEFDEGGATVEMINLAANYAEAWVGTDAEAMLYDYTTSRWDIFAYPPKLSDSVTKCVLTGDASIWFGTQRGLGKLDRQLIGRIEHIRRENR